MAERRVAATIWLLLILGAVTLSGCGGPGKASERPLTDANASPDAIIAAWAEVACPNVSVDRSDDTATADVVAIAKCELDIAGTRSDVTQYIEVYDSREAVKTKMATVDCSKDFLRLTGPMWYSLTRVQEVATGLQKAGATLACA